MPIEFHCPGCSKLLRTPDESAGKRAKCPQCGTIADVPAPPFDSGREAPASPPRGKSGWTPGDTSSGSPFAEPSSGPLPGRTSDWNPYASPAPATFSPLAEGAGAMALVHQRISLDDLLNRSWGVFKEQLGPCALLGLVYMAVYIGVSIATAVFRVAAQLTEEFAILVAAMILEQVVGLLINTFLQLGLILFSIRLLRTGEARLNDLFGAGRCYLRGLLVTILLQVMVVGSALLCVGPGLIALLSEADPLTFGPLLAVGIVAGVTCVIYLAMRFYLAIAFVVDRDMGVFQSLRASSTHMAGNKLTAFLAGLIVGILGGLFGLLTCCIGFVLVVPYMGVFLATIYLLATNQTIHQPLIK